jgi:branched-chain amino acid transport system substrate-binding protein
MGFSAYFRYRRPRVSLLRTAAALVTAGLLAAACSSTSGSGGTSGGVPKGNTLTVGTLYAGSGDFAESSIPELNGFKFWMNQVNANGGVYVQGLHKKFRVKLVAYNDQSDPTTAGTLYNQLITKDKVNIFMADFGSVLTAPAVTLAKEHQMVLFDPTGTGATFFQSGPNPYLALTSLPSSGVWPKPLVQFLISEHVHNVAIIYCANDFDQSQANTIAAGLKAAGDAPVYFQAIPTTTSDYGTLIQAVKAKQPGAVIELGYPNNDIAFLNNLRSSAVHFPMVLTAFPPQLPALFLKDVGAAGLNYTFGYGVPPVLAINKVSFGMGFSQFSAAFTKANGTPVNFLNVAGYNAGLIIQAALAHTKTLSQLGIRAGLSAISGHTTTLTGQFMLNNAGAQLGDLLPIAQYVPASAGAAGFKIVYPPSQASTQPIYPAPAH